MSKNIFFQANHLIHLFLEFVKSKQFRKRQISKNNFAALHKSKIPPSEWSVNSLVNADDALHNYTYAYAQLESNTRLFSLHHVVQVPILARKI